MGRNFELNDGLPRGCTPRRVHYTLLPSLSLIFSFPCRFLKNNLEYHMFCVGRLEGGFDTTALWQRPDPIDRLDGQPEARG